MFAECSETVSILYALVFGAGEACVRIDIWSILSAFAAFMVGVVILQVLARRLWARLTQGPDIGESLSEAAPSEPRTDKPFHDDPSYRHSAIRSSRR
ncbi:hypothetical protein [Yoonia sp.]|uniref:hypothetical protein n=1 Tax=Yoonia sp. TaxID=2212373 RepID=UPI002FDB0EEC